MDEIDFEEPVVMDINEVDALTLSQDDFEDSDD